MQFQPSYSNTVNVTVIGDLNDVSKADSELSKSSLPEVKIKKTTLKTLAKRVVNRTDPFYFIDIIVIGNYDLWLENCIPKDLSLGIKGVLANLHFTITSCGECLFSSSFIFFSIIYFRTMC
jgi:hypothetical protein